MESVHQSAQHLHEVLSDSTTIDLSGQFLQLARCTQKLSWERTMCTYTLLVLRQIMLGLVAI